MLQLNMKESILYIINGVLLTATFGLFRIGLWFYLVYVYAVFKEVTFTSAIQILPKICVSGTAVLLCMNAYWFFRILSKFVQSVRKLLKTNDICMKTKVH